MARKKSNTLSATDDRDVHARVTSGIPRTEQTQQVLDDSHLRQLNSIIQECERTHAMCTACHDAGIDVAPEMSTNSEQLEMARKLKAYFFPHAS